ncbi:MAG: hypothetical protein NTW25_00400 [Candidatus Kapabacteria bacterium]|nr:hypothetical protein [Candidatus Kapabacteria bacterium]
MKNVNAYWSNGIVVTINNDIPKQVMKTRNVDRTAALFKSIEMQIKRIYRIVNF